MAAVPLHLVSAPVPHSKQLQVLQAQSACEVLSFKLLAAADQGKKWGGEACGRSSVCVVQGITERRYMHGVYSLKLARATLKVHSSSTSVVVGGPCWRHNPAACIEPAAAELAHKYMLRNVSTSTARDQVAASAHVN